MSIYQPCTPHDTLHTCYCKSVHTCNGYLSKSAAAYAADCNHTDLQDSCLTTARIIMAASGNQAASLCPMQLWLILFKQLQSFPQHNLPYIASHALCKQHTTAVHLNTVHQLAVGLCSHAPRSPAPFQADTQTCPPIILAVECPKAASQSIRLDEHLARVL